ncbi:MAG: tRNA uridine(34) 5-carboxymethylaminomethyl modification radical SAM/GNAT enzyme Elp3 [Candidatus Magasanikbacteria bacterium]
MTNIEEKIILDCYKKQPKDAEALNSIKRRILRTEKSDYIPTSTQLLQAYHKLVKENKIKISPQLEKNLLRRAVRTLSGVTIVTVLTKSFPCPGKCVYCPTEARMPKSYLSDEPAAARALSLQFDPYEQVRRRLDSLEKNGHPTDKVELIVKGGTWNAYPLKYQYWFIARCFEACNRTKKTDVSEKMTLDDLQKKIVKMQTKNESAKHRIIGLTLETRPDCINEKTIADMRLMGCTRIEMGIQHTDENILKLTKRGHGVAESVRASALLRKYGFKLDYHLMPQLPGSTPSKDLKMLREIFSDNRFRPDMIKIYPCTVVENSELYSWLASKKFKPYSDKQLLKILKEFKSDVPYYVRISRLIRDIPSNHIKAGNMITNLRQYIQTQMAAEGTKCRCLRCREIGHQTTLDWSKEKIEFFIDVYESSGGTEYFLSFENSKRDAVLGFCRLRIDKNGIYPAFIRELHVYGQSVEIAQRQKGASQHIGLGKKLMQAAIKICKQNKIPRLAVISGVGVRGYYRKMGAKLENTYMVFNIK